MAKKKKSGLKNMGPSFFDKLQFGTKARSRIWRKLAVCIKAGVTVGEALQMIWIHTSQDGRKPDHPVAKIISNWRKDISNGKTLGEAILPWVPESEQNLIAAGEKSDLYQAIQDLLQIQDAKKKISGTIIKGLIYPVILALAGCGFLMMFATRIVPQFNEVLPVSKWHGPPVVMATAGAFFTHYIIVIFSLVVATIIGITISLPRWTGKLRITFDKIPPWSLYRLYSGSGFMLIMSSMLSAGSPPLKILDTIRKNSTPWLDERMAATERFVLGGKNIGDALYDTGFQYPDKETVLDLRAYAKQADFAEILRKISDIWIEESVGKVKAQTVVMQNVALLFAASVIIGFLLSIGSLEFQVLGSQGA